MSKQHFEMIARVLREANRHEAVDPTFREGWHAAVSAIGVRFADELNATNPRFDRSRFVAACMGEDSTDSAGRKVRYSTGA
jgi:hypothetical protein